MPWPSGTNRNGSCRCMHGEVRLGGEHLLPRVGQRLHARLDRVNGEHEGVLQGAGHRSRQHVLRAWHTV